MTDELAIGVVASPRAWRAELQSHVRNHVSGIRLIVLREPRAAFAADIDVVVLDDVASLLSPRSVGQLQERGVRIVGVYDPEEDEGQGKRFLEDLGVDLTVAAEVAPEELLAGIAALGPRVPPFTDGELDQFIAELGPDADADAARTDGTGARGASVIAVGGPPGGVGASEVALGLAAALAARREPTIVIDADTVAPSLARRLGYELDPNVLAALDALRYAAAPLRQQLAVRDPGLPGTVHFDAVVGLANTSDWPELREGDLVELVAQLREDWGHVVVDVGSGLEDLETFGPARYGAARAIVARAEVILGLCAPNPVGLLRFLDWAALVQEVAPGTALWAVINQAPRSRFRRGQLERQLRANMAPGILAGVSFLPADAWVAQATWDGAPVAPGPFRKAVEDLAGALVPRSRRRRRGRRTEKSRPGVRS